MLIFIREPLRSMAFFFPGGDPGSNHPKYVLPFLKAIAAELKLSHPSAGMWVSLQGFSDEEVNYFYDYLEKYQPNWLAGVVTGPSSLIWPAPDLDYPNNTSTAITQILHIRCDANIPRKIGIRHLPSPKGVKSRILSRCIMRKYISDLHI